MRQRITFIKSILGQMSPFWKPTAIVIYGVVLVLTAWPMIHVIAARFLRDMGDPALEGNPVLRACAIVALYVGFFALDAVLCVALVGSIAVGVMLVVYEVTRLSHHIQRSQLRASHGRRRPNPPDNVTPIMPPHPSSTGSC